MSADKKNAAIAQLVERQTEDLKVLSSIPPGRTEWTRTLNQTRKKMNDLVIGKDGVFIKELKRRFNKQIQRRRNCIVQRIARLLAVPVQSASWALK